MASRACQFCQNHQNLSTDVFLCLWVHWSTTKVFRVIAQRLYGLNLRLNLHRITKETSPKTEYPWKKNIFYSSSGNLRPLFNSYMTKVYVIKWSQNWTRTIRGGVFGIAKNVRITCFACILQLFGYANNNTSDSLSAILRPLYSRYFCHITIGKWSHICNRTNKKCILKDILVLGAFSIVFPIKNSISN